MRRDDAPASRRRTGIALSARPGDPAHAVAAALQEQAVCDTFRHAAAVRRLTNESGSSAPVGAELAAGAGRKDWYSVSFQLADLDEASAPN
jgi:hypothetical protein